MAQSANKASPLWGYKRYHKRARSGVTHYWYARRKLASRSPMKA